MFLIRLYFPIGVLSLLLFLPITYLYLKSDKALQPKHCITMALYPKEGYSGCYSHISPIYSVQLYDSLNNFTKKHINKFKNDSKKGGNRWNRAVLKLPEFKTYGDFVSTINVFMDDYPYFNYVPQLNFLYIGTGDEVKSINDLDGGWMITTIYREPKLSFIETISVGIDRLTNLSRHWYNAVTLNYISKISFILWLVLLYLNIYRLKSFLKRKAGNRLSME